MAEKRKKIFFRNVLHHNKLLLRKYKKINYKVSFAFAFICCRSFDKKNTGKISEKVFKQIMIGKDDVNESDIEEMLEEYYR